MADVIVLGSGPAGCTAAVYLCRAGFTVRVLEGIQPGGQLTITTEVDNYPGFPEGIAGPALMAQMKAQAERFGTQFVMEEAEAVEVGDGSVRVRHGGAADEAKALIVATGASARWLGVPGEEKLRGRGVSACATCDGAFFAKRAIAIVGGGDSALTEALFLTRFASKVTIIHRRQGFRAAQINVEATRNHPKIDLLLDAVVEEVLGDKRVQGVRVKNVATGAVSELPLEGLFVAVGHTPNTGFLKGVLDLDADGYILTRDGTRTSAPGVFAAGDVVDKVYRQAITSAGTGCMAALDAERYLAHRPA